MKKRFIKIENLFTLEWRQKAVAQQALTEKKMSQVRGSVEAQVARANAQEEAVKEAK